MLSKIKFMILCTLRLHPLIGTIDLLFTKLISFHRGSCCLGICGVAITLYDLCALVQLKLSGAYLPDQGQFALLCLGMTHRDHSRQTNWTLKVTLLVSTTLAVAEC